MKGSSSRPSAWSPQLGPQTEALLVRWCLELLYGGAAGGGKSDFLLGDFLQDVETYGQWWRGVLFRRTYPELQELIVRSQEIYPLTGAKWYEADKEWHWPNGAYLRMRYLERDADCTRYQGHQYTWIGWDELTQWASLFAYRYLRARLRSAGPVPTKRIRATANPGGVGHHAVKEYFIDAAPMGYQSIIDAKTGLERMFIPSRIQDNKILLLNDPSYIARLRGLGSDALVKAWLEGDWNVISGAYFPEFSTARHVIEPCELPDHWTRFRAMDWGSASPFSVGWYAVSDGTDNRFPTGALIRYREWYGMGSEPNVGLKMTAEQVADGITLRESEDLSYAVLDPSAFREDGGPSIAETMNVRLHTRFFPADNARVPLRGAMGGWNQVRNRLIGEDERPMLYVFSTCTHLIRTLPALQHDDARPEDVDTDGEDHAPDELRYACMSRPWTSKAPKSIEPIKGIESMTLNDMWAKQKPRKETRI